MRAARVDRNQIEIVRALRTAGCTVLILSTVGNGCPDILIGVPGATAEDRRNLLCEIKDGSKPPSARELTMEQIDFHIHWRGQVAVVTSVAEALALAGVTV